MLSGCAFSFLGLTRFIAAALSARFSSSSIFAALILGAFRNISESAFSQSALAAAHRAIP